jgi:hypothetical protein
MAELDTERSGADEPTESEAELSEGDLAQAAGGLSEVSSGPIGDDYPPPLTSGHEPPPDQA